MLFARAIAALAAAAALGAGAQYPQRNVTIVVPFTPGTGADLIARILQPKLADALKVAVIVDNKAGASGAIGTQAVADAPPDGYTLLFTATSHGTLPATRHDLPYEPERSFTPVALTATSAMAFVVSPQLGVRTFADFVRLARKKPGAMYYSSPGNGSIQHMTMELTKLESGMDIVHVPYKGSTGARTDILSGQIQMLFDSVPTMAHMAKSGMVRALGTSGMKRSPILPDVPTLD